MILEEKWIQNEYFCDLTDMLDRAARFDLEKYPYMRHYILADNFCKKDKCLVIRVPGGSIGGIWVDDNNQIINIAIDTNYVIRTYCKNVKDLLQQFIGMTIEYKERDS